MNTGVPAGAQQDWQHLCCAKMQVQFPVWHSGLKDPALLQLQYKLQLAQELHIPQGSQKWKEKKKKKKKKKERIHKILKPCPQLLDFPIHACIRYLSLVFLFFWRGEGAKIRHCVFKSPPSSVHCLLY